MSIYTRTGDHGETDLPGGVRVAKDAALLEVCGALDELNAWLGLARCEPLIDDIEPLLKQVQRQLFRVGAQLVASGPERSHAAAIDSGDVQALERAIDRYASELTPLDDFVLPSGCRAAAVLHLARAVCRRAERRLVRLARADGVQFPSQLLAYTNRLGDLLFVLARFLNAKSGIDDIPC